MNKKAFQIAMSTLVVIILAVVVLAAIIFAVKGGFKDLGGATDPFTDTATATAIKTACQSACDNSVKITYCCSEYAIDDKTVKCTNPGLGVTCNLDCTDFSCE